MKRLHVLAAVLLGTAVMALGYLLREHTTAVDFLFFPGLAVGSLLFGHSLSMAYTAMAVNLVFYWLVSFAIVRFFVGRDSKSPH
jgi:hypothetical protein